MKLSELLTGLTSLYLQTGDKKIDLLLEDSITNKVTMYRIQGVTIAQHTSKENEGAIKFLVRMTRSK
jgi:hypothetical protein